MGQAGETIRPFRTTAVPSIVTVAPVRVPASPKPALFGPPNSSVSPVVADTLRPPARVRVGGGDADRPLAAPPVRRHAQLARGDGRHVLAFLDGLRRDHAVV